MAPGSPLSIRRGSCPTLEYAYMKRDIERKSDATVHVRSATKLNKMADRVSRIQQATRHRSMEVTLKQHEDRVYKGDASMKRITAEKMTLKRRPSTPAPEDSHVSFLGAIANDLTSAMEKMVERIQPDFVKQKRLEWSLKESKQQYRQVLEQSLRLKYSHK